MPRLLLFLPLVLFFILGLFLWKGLSLDPKELPSALIDKPFPDFSLDSLLPPVKKLTNADFPGQPVLVNVWATWCPSCRQEHNDLMAIAASGEIGIVGLNYKDDRAAATRWLEDLGNPYLYNIYDEMGLLGLDLGVYGAPETYLVDADGIVRFRHVGVINDEVLSTIRGILRGDSANEKS